MRSAKFSLYFQLFCGLFTVSLALFCIFILRKAFEDFHAEKAGMKYVIQI